jgi:hypothetical protein
VKAHTSISLPYNWTLRHYQVPLWSAMEKGCKRAMCVWHRRAGKGATVLHWTVRAMMERVGTYWHVLPTYKQGRMILWEGMTGDREAPRPFRSFIPKELIVRELNDEMTTWLANGSVHRIVGADDVDRLVGSNPVGVVLDEFSLMDSGVWDFIRPILVENGGWVIFIFTPRGRNFAWRLWSKVQGNPEWFTQKLTVEDTGVISMEEIESERAAGMSEELIQQEFFASFEAPMEGSYFGKQIVTMEREKRITRVPWEPAKPVISAWDLGIGDDTAIWFAQQVNAEIRLIDFHVASGKGMDYYAKVMTEKPYAIPEHLVPHDAAVREYTGKSRVELARSLGMRMRIVPKVSLADRISATRAILPRIWADEEKCAYGLQALREYRRQRDKYTQEYRDLPHKDWATHPADALGTLAMGLRREREQRLDLNPRIAIV